MDDAQTWAVAYLGAQGRVPWLWADDGDVLVWKDGTTVAFRQEIIQVLEWLVPHGWPPFGALVWLFAACRGKLPPAFSLPAGFGSSGSRRSERRASGGRRATGPLP